MVVDRKVSKSKYIMSFVFTVLIFSLGLTLGIIIDNARLNSINLASKEQEVNYKSIQFQYTYLNFLKEEKDSCLVIHGTLDNAISDLGKSLDKFIQYNKNTQINSREYHLDGRSYLLDNLKYWLLANEAKKKCDLDVVSILYFFSEDCSSCPDQGVILTYFKKKFGDKLLVFPLNIGLESDEGILRIVKNQFNITTIPAVVVENKKYEGVINKDILGGVICSHFKDKSNC